MCSVKVSALADSDGIIARGKDANGIGWFLYDDGKILISGTGSMEDYDSTYSIPWYDYRKDIKEIVIEAGVDHVAARAFYNCINATKAEIPATVQSIGQYAFKNCDTISIYGAKDSFAHTYANTNSIPFVPVAILLNASVTQEETAARRYFHVSVPGYTEEAHVFIGVYDSDDTLLAAYKESFVQDDVTSVSTLKADNEKYVKVFVWNNGVCPVTSVKRIDLN